MKNSTADIERNLINSVKNFMKQFNASTITDTNCESQRITTTHSWWLTYSVQSCHWIHWSLICFADIVFRDYQFDSVPSFWLVKPLVCIDCYLGSQRFSKNQNITHYSIVWAEKCFILTKELRFSIIRQILKFLPVCITAQWCDSNFEQKCIHISRW